MKISVAAVGLLLGLAMLTTSGSAQQLMALRAEWGDLQTWSSDVGNTRERELGLGLQLSGSSGSTLLAFMARTDTRNPLEAPRDVVAQIAVGRLTNPNIVREPVLSFTINPDGENMSTLDLSGRLTVDSTLGGTPENGVAVLSADDFVQLAEADTLSANVFGFDAPLRADQVQAIKDFAERVHLSAR